MMCSADRNSREDIVRKLGKELWDGRDNPIGHEVEFCGCTFYIRSMYKNRELVGNTVRASYDNMKREQLTTRFPKSFGRKKFMKRLNMFFNKVTKTSNLVVERNKLHDQLDSAKLTKSKMLRVAVNWIQKANPDMSVAYQNMSISDVRFWVKKIKGLGLVKEIDDDDNVYRLHTFGNSEWFPKKKKDDRPIKAGVQAA